MIIDVMLYIKSTHSEDMFLWQCGHYNISMTSLSSMMAILLVTYFHGIDTTI